MTNSQHAPDKDRTAKWFAGLKQIPRGVDVVVHVGAPKTGTSAIQKHLCENRAYFEQRGFYYPIHKMQADSISSGQSALYTALAEGDHPQALFDRYLREATDKNCTLLLSSETFWVVPEKFCQLLRGHTFAVLVFLRHPYDAVVSSYNQLVKRHFSTMSLAEFIRHNAQQDRLHMAGERLSAWIEQIGDENLVVNSYLKSAMLELGVSRVVSRVLGRDDHPDAEAPRQLLNSSYPPHVLELKRMLNVILERNEKVNRQIDGILQEVAEAHNRAALARNREPSIGIAPEPLRLLHRYLPNFDAELSARYGINLFSELHGESSVSEQMADLGPVVATLNRNERIHHFLRDRIDRYMGDSSGLKNTLSDAEVRAVLEQLDGMFPRKNALKRLLHRIF